MSALKSEIDDCLCVCIRTAKPEELREEVYEIDTNSELNDEVCFYYTSKSLFILIVLFLRCATARWISQNRAFCSRVQKVGRSAFSFTSPPKRSNAVTAS